MSDLKILTSPRLYHLSPFFALPEKVRKDFDYVEGEDQNSDRFVCYRDAWYDTGDVQAIRVETDPPQPMGWAMTVAADHPFAKWDAIVSETYFSGILFRHREIDGEWCVNVGRYYS
ncbi:MAG: hypothetical protein ACSLE8_06240 [Rhodococcus sp. (in: high G+C Gram-positive bacteria)]